MSNMLGRFGIGKKGSKGQTPTKSSDANQEKQVTHSSFSEDDTTGFICPICMKPFPGPSELQAHFGSTHNEGTIAENELTDAMPLVSHSHEDGHDSSSLISSSQSTEDFQKGKLVLDIDQNAADSEKELAYLRQDLADMSAALKEEKWYSGQLKKEMDKIMAERDKLEEEKLLNDEQYTLQLRAAEESFLTVVSENDKLKQELTFADYKSQKDRDEKMKTQVAGLRQQMEEEMMKRQAADHRCVVLEKQYEECKSELLKLDNLLKERPSADQVQVLQKEVLDLQLELQSTKRTREADVLKMSGQWNEKLSQATVLISSLETTIKELKLQNGVKEEQMLSLQVALASASDSSKQAHQASLEKQQLVLSLQHEVAQLQSSCKEKDSLVTCLESQLLQHKLEFASEVNARKALQEQLHLMQGVLEEEKIKMTTLLAHLQNLEGIANKGKAEVSRLEREKVELIAKIEAGEGTDTVIHQLSHEKEKLLETLHSVQATLSMQMEQNAATNAETRKEKTQLSENLLKANNCIESLKLENGNLDKTIHALQQQLADSKSDIKAKIEDLHSLESRWIQERGDKDSTISDLEKERSRLLELEERLSQELHNREAKIIQLDQELVKQQDSCVKREGEFMSLEKGLQDLVQQHAAQTADYKLRNDQLQAHNSAIELALREAEMRSEKLALDVAVVVEQSGILSADLAAAKNELMKGSLEIEQLKADKKMMERVETELLLKKDAQDREVTNLEHELRAANEELKNERVGREAETTAMKDSLHRLDTRVSELTALLADERSQRQTEAHEKDKENRHLRDIVTSSKEENSGLAVDLTNARKALEIAQVNLQNEIVIRSKLDAQVLELQGKLEKLNHILEQKDDVLKDLQLQYELAEQEIKKPCERCRNYEMQLCRLQEATKDQSGQISKLNEVIGQLKDASKASEEKLSDFVAKLDEDSKQNEEQQSLLKVKINNLSEEKSSLQILAEETRRELNGSLEKCEALEAVEATLRSDLAMRESELQQLLTKKVVLESEAVNWKADVALLKDQLDKLELSSSTQKQLMLQENADLLSRLQENEDLLKKEIASHSFSKETALKIQNVLREEATALQNKLENSTRERQELAKSKDIVEMRLLSDIRSLEEMGKTVRGEVDKLNRKISEYELRVKTLEHSKDELKGDVAVLEAQLQNTNEEKKALLERVLESEENLKKSKHKQSETNRRLDQALSALQELGQENQNLQVQQVLKLNRQWENDADVTKCKKCEKGFSVTFRKHHCRNCGAIFCKECTKYQATVAASKTAVRVCEPCYKELDDTRGSTSRRLSTVSSASMR